MTIIYLFIAWVCGLIIGQSNFINLAWWVWLLLGAGISLAALMLPTEKKLPRERDPLQFAPLLLGIMLLGAAALTYSTRPSTEADLRQYNDEGWVTLEGVILGTPDLREQHVNLRVAVTHLRQDGEPPRKVQGLLLAQADYGPDYSYGDRITLRGQLRTPPEFADFSYRDYLAREGVFSYMPRAQVTPSGERDGLPPLRAIFDIRQAAQTHIMRLLPDPAASLLAGILLGIESGIASDTRTAFNAVGASHVIAISGSNMVILGKLVERVSKRVLNRKATGLLTIGVIAVYAVFVGADASVVRAAIMVILVTWASLIDRPVFAPASLAAAGFAMTLHNPLVLWDVGFQLSFAATLGLALYVEPLEKGFTRLLEHMTSTERVQQVLGITSEALIVTIAAQITTTPIIAYYFGRLSLLSLAVNLLIVPVQSFIMVLGGLGVMAAFILEPIGQILLWGAYIFLSWTNGVVVWFARLAPVEPTAYMGLPAVVLTYAGIFGLTAVLSHPPHSEKHKWGGTWLPRFVAGGLAVGVTLITLAGCALPDGYMHIRFLDIGETNATLITSPSGRHILVDTGSSGRTLTTELGRAMPYWQRRIDVVVLTQGRSDYIDSLRVLTRRYQVDTLVTNGAHTTNPDLQAIIAEHNIRTVWAEVGTRITVEDGLHITVMDAPREPPPDGELANPLVLHVAYGEGRYLLTGMMRTEQIPRLDPAKLDVTVLQIPRGGHRDVTTSAVLQGATPQLSVISINAGNRFDLPHREVLSRLADFGGHVYRTDIHGTIHLWSDGQQIWAETEK